MASQLPIPAYVLAGGRSRRFGGNKAVAVVDGQPQLLQLSGQLRRAGHRVLVVSDRADRYRDLGVTSLVDPVAQSGPMSGLLAALLHAREHAPEGWLMLVSCDQLLWQHAWYEQLVGQAGPDRQAVVFRAENCTEATAGPLPLPGLFHCSLVSAIEHSISAGQLSLRRFLSELPTCGCILTASPPSLWSFNTPAELQNLLDQRR